MTICGSYSVFTCELQPKILGEKVAWRSLNLLRHTCNQIQSNDLFSIFLNQFRNKNMYILADPCILYCPQRDVINGIKLGYQKKVIVSHSQKVNMFSDFFRSHKGENSYINRLCETLTVYANLHTQWQLYKQRISLILFSFWSQIYYLFGRNVKQPFLRLIVKDFLPYILSY